MLRRCLQACWAGALLFGQTIFYSQDFNTPADWSDWQLNTSDMGSTPSGYNLWRVGADYNNGVTSFEFPCAGVLCIGPINVPLLPAQPAAIVGNPNSPFLHISYDGNYSASAGCTAPNQPTTSFLAADGLCAMAQNYFAKMTQDIAIPAGAGQVKLSFFWLCEGGNNAYGQVLYSTNGGATWNALSSSLPGVGAQFKGRSAQWYADTITLPITRPANLRLAVRFVNGVSTQAADPSFAIDAIRVFEVPVAAPPTIDITNIPPVPSVCAGSTVSVAFATTGTFGAGNTFTAQLSDATGSFAAPVSTASGASPISLPIPSTLASGTYKVRVVSSNPVTVSDTVDVQVVNLGSLACSANPNPTSPGTAVTLTISGTGLPAGTFNVQLNPGDGSPPQSQNGVTLPVSFTHTYSTAGTYTATFTVTHPGSGCSATCQVTVTVQPPTANTIDLVSVVPATVCAGGALTATFTSSGTFNAGNLFRVQLSDATGSFAAPQNIGVGAASPITATVPATTPSGSYRVRVVSTSPVVISDTLSIEVVNLSGLTCSYTPNPALVGTPTTLTIGGTGLPNGPFDVQVDADGDGTADYTQNGVNLPYNFSHTYSSGGTYTVTFTVRHPASGCTGTCTQTVTVQGQGLSLVSLSPDTLCAGESFTASYTSVGITFAAGNTFTLEGLDEGGAVVFTCSASGTAPSGTLNCTVPVGTPPGTYTVQLRSSNPAYTSGPLSLVVSPTPVADFAPDAGLRYCLGTAISFTDRSQNATSVRWDFGDGTTSTDRNPTHTYAAPGQYTVTLTAQVSATCTDQVQRTVEILPLPQASFTVSPPTLLLPDQNTISLTNASTGAVSYQWDFGNGQTSTAPNPTATYDQEGEYLIVLTALSADGCRDTAQYRLVVRYAQGLLIPNAFTPNGDGMNDRFAIRYTGMQTIRVALYDRWGNLIFTQQQAGPTGTVEWDGTRNGQPAPEGVYTGFLEARTTDGRTVSKGFTLTLLR